MAAGLMLGALMLLSLQDGLIKLTSAEISLWQMQAVRACGNLLLLAMLSWLMWRGPPPAPKRLWAIALRSSCLLGAMILLFGGIPALSLAEIAAGLYVFPLFVAVLSAVLLGERVGPRRISAVCIGFCGTLLILKPGTASFQWVSLMPVAAGLCYAGTILSTRRLCRDEHPVTLAFGVAISFVLAGAIGLVVMDWAAPPALAAQWPYLFTGWHAMELWVFGLVAACSLLNLTANIALTRAYQSAESSWLAPFDYSYLIFATFWGFVMWGHVPDVASCAGMALIAASGSYVAWRERQLARA